VAFILNSFERNFTSNDDFGDITQKVSAFTVQINSNVNTENLPQKNELMNKYDICT
jgi:hypothetical protein